MFNTEMDHYISKVCVTSFQGLLFSIICRLSKKLIAKKKKKKSKFKSFNSTLRLSASNIDVVTSLKRVKTLNRVTIQKCK